MQRATPVTERFFLGGNSSPFSLLGVPTVLGFRTRGVGPTEARRQIVDDSSPDRDFVGGDVAVSTFADLSFDLPFHWSKRSGIYGHVFACAGNLAKLSQHEYRNFSFENFVSSYRSSVGAGIVVPTNLIRVEVSSLCFLFHNLFCIL